jgi:hypothetical protein
MKKQIQEFKDIDKFLSIFVYQFPLGNCGGVTDVGQSGEKTIYIPCSEGPHNFYDIDNKELIFIPEQRSEEYWALKPLMQEEGLCGPMAGGNLAYSSDSRCKRVYHIHDRFETWEANEMLNR